MGYFLELLIRKRIIGNLIGFVIRREVLGILWYSWPEEEEWVIVAKRQISNFPTISWRGPSTVDEMMLRYKTNKFSWIFIMLA